MEERVGPLTFTSNFDSGNLARAERVKSEENSGVEEVDDFSAGNVVTPDYEYNVWTNPDCAGTEFENLNRTWFHFGVKGGTPGKLLKINIMNLNRQGKLYAQGMSVIVKVVPGKNKWERIREKPTYEVSLYNLWRWFIRLPSSPFQLLPPVLCANSVIFLPKLINIFINCCSDTGVLNPTQKLLLSGPAVFQLWHRGIVASFQFFF